MKKHSAFYIIVIAGIIGLSNAAAIANTIDLTSGYWAVSAGHWTGSKLVIQTQTQQGSDFKVTGYFDWIKSGSFVGREILEGTFFNDFSLHLVGKYKSGEISLCIYNAHVNVEGTEIIGGTWTRTSGGSVAGTWSAVISDYQAGYEAGIQKCKNDPASCGINTGIGVCNQLQLQTKYVEGYNAGCSACTGSSGECATFNMFTNTLHVPCLDMGTIYWLDLSMTGSDPVMLELIGFGESN